MSEKPTPISLIGSCDEKCLQGVVKNPPFSAADVLVLSEASNGRTKQASCGRL